MAVRKYNRKPIDVRELGGALGLLLASCAEEMKRRGPEADPLAVLHDVVHHSATMHDAANPPPAFEERELALGLLDGLHHYFHHRGINAHG